MRNRLLNIAFAVVCGAVIGAAHSAHVAAAAAPTGELRLVSIGCGGHVRLGEWTHVVCELDEAQLARGPHRLRVSCRDVDDQPVVYEGAALPHPADPRRVLGHCLLGRWHGRVEIELLDSESGVIAQCSIGLHPAGTEPRLWPATTRLVAYCGIAAHSRSLVLGQGNRPGGESQASLELADARQLPWHWRGLRNLDTVVLAATDADFLSELTEAQIDALCSWVQAGGKLVLWANADLDRHLAGRRLIEQLVPGRWLGAATLQSSSSLEFHVRAREALLNSARPTAPVVRIDPTDCQVSLRQDDIPIVVRRPLGFGQVTFVALPLDESPLSEWSGSASLLDQIVLGLRLTEERGAATESFSSRVTHYGYRDLSGQVRSALEQFRNVQVVSFTAIAVLIGAFVIVAGPLDYLLVRRWLKRPEWTWVSFPLWVVLFSAAAIGIASLAKPKQFAARSLELIDWDSRSGQLRGTQWWAVYSPKSQLATVTYRVAHPVVGEIQRQEVAVMGQPGTGLGGTESERGIGWQQRAYHCVLSDSSTPADVALQGLPLPVSGTRSLVGEWQGTTEVPVRSRLRVNPRTGRLTGNVVNPLDVPLRNVRILHENWGYEFSAVLAPGESFDLVESRERTVKGALTWRATLSEDQSQGEPWSVADGDLRRIARMLMFHQAAGGQAYTSLTHTYWNRIDMSDSLHTGNAILVAEISPGGGQLDLTGRPIAAVNEDALVILRLLLPVSQGTRDGRLD